MTDTRRDAVPAVQVQGLTRAFGPGRGVFDLGFRVEPGEAFGYLGPNGAGKTTTLRLLMGFLRPGAGSAQIAGLDCFSQAAEVQRLVGYLPGELSLMEDMTGRQFILLIAGMKGVKDPTRARQLAERFELDETMPIRKMSKGTKQKVGLVCAFLASPQVLLLDEPTSGLDPLMQNRFLQLLQEEKQRGATILLSSHLFEEVERTCDRAAMLRAGRIVYEDTLEHLRSGRGRCLMLELPDAAAAAALVKAWPGAVQRDRSVELTVRSDELPGLLCDAGRLGAVDVQSRAQTLEELFLHLYESEGGNGQ
ncbi:MAG: ABC transporter ATP-binding protein [Gemmiger sp.]